MSESQTFWRNIRVLLVTLCASAAAPRLSIADAPLAQPAKPTPPVRSATPSQAAPGKAAVPAKSTPAASQPPSDKEEAERRKILESRQWRETVHAFNEWLSVQKIYPRAEVKKIRAELNHKIAKMSAQQLRDFLEDTQDKMKILMSKESEDARMWLAQRMAVEVRATPEELKESRPDVVHMTSAQLEENLHQIEAQRTRVRQTQKGFDSGRQAAIKDIKHEGREQQREREEALDRAAAAVNTPYGNYYQPNINPGGIPGPGAFGGSAPSFWFGYPY